MKTFRVNLGIYDIQTAWMIDNAISSSMSCHVGEEIDKKLHIMSAGAYFNQFDFTDDELIHYTFWFPCVGFTTRCEACIFYSDRNNDGCHTYNPYDILKEHIDYYIAVLERVRNDGFKMTKAYAKSSFNECNLDSLNRCKFLLKFLSGTATKEEKEKYAGIPFDPFKQSILENKIKEYPDLAHVRTDVESKWYQMLYKLRYDTYNPDEFKEYWVQKKKV